MTAASVASAARVPRRLPADTVARRPWLPWVAPLLGLVGWLVAIATMHPDALTPWGLLPLLPAPYWIGLAAVLLSGLLLTQAPRVHHAALLAHTAVLVLLLYAISPAVEAVPRYTYTYKHIGITSYIEKYGSVDTNIDIYHRWPGFFSLSAWFSQVAGLPDPTSYAAWAEPFFAALDGLLVWCCAQAVLRSARFAWLAVLLFTGCNWIGQNYYSPQAFAYLLMLGVLLTALVSLQGRGNGIGRWAENLLRRLARVRVPTVDEGDPPTAGHRWRAALLVVLLDAAITTSHQLTPYVLLLQLGGLVVAGYLRPWWLAVVTGVVTIGWLIPNLDYIINTFGLLSAPDPLANATQKNVDGTPILEARFVLYVGALSFLSVFVLGLVGVVRRARTGRLRSALGLAVLVFASPAMLAGQSYGGEARLRVLLYALPWGCAAACWAMSPTGQRLVRQRLWAPVVNGAFFASAFVVMFFGHEDLQLLTPAEVRAAAFLSDPGSVKPESVVVLLAPNFPSRYGALYYRAGGELEPLSYDRFGQKHALEFADESDVAFVAGKIRGPSGARTGYVLFSRGQDNWARDYQLYPPGALRAFESAVARSPRFALVYSEPTARIYELVT